MYKEYVNDFIVDIKAIGEEVVTDSRNCTPDGYRPFYINRSFNINFFTLDFVHDDRDTYQVILGRGNDDVYVVRSQRIITKVWKYFSDHFLMDLKKCNVGPVIVEYGIVIYLW